MRREVDFVSCFLRARGWQLSVEITHTVQQHAQQGQQTATYLLYHVFLLHLLYFWRGCPFGTPASE